MPKMNSEQWQNLETVFDSALQLKPSERPDFLKTTCADDLELRREVESLLAADDVEDDFLRNDEFDNCMKIMAQETLQDPVPPRVAFESGLFTGTILNDRWEILPALDEGGMGQVYKARDVESNKLAVVKLLKREARADEWIVKKFGQEGDALSKVNHKNVAELYERGTTPNGQPYLVVEFVEGLTLRKFIVNHLARQSQISHSDIAEIVTQLGSGINAIHQANLVHRDLKPENIIVNSKHGETTVKIIDFGIARLLDRSTKAGQVVGTIDYMAPEQLQAREDVSAATDVYAFAAIAYEIITGRRPFEVPDDPPAREKVAKLLDLQQKGLELLPSKQRGNIPKEVDALIARGLSFESQRRPRALQFAQELVQPFNVNRHSTSVFASKFWQIAVPVMLVLILGSWLIWNRAQQRIGAAPPSNATLAAVRQRGLAYSLTVKRQRDGKIIRVTGRETFDTGDEFRFNITPFEAGALYIFNEGISKDWHVLFPTLETSKGDSRVALSETITTGENVFTEAPAAEKGTESIWIVWAAEPVPLLEALVKKSLDNELQIIEATDKAALDRFIREKAALRPEVTVNAEQSQVTLKSEADVLVYLLKLEHIDWK